MDKASLSIFKFYWLCTKDAVSTTIEKRYAWAWGILAGFIWVILAAMTSTQMDETGASGAANLEIASESLQE